MAGDTRCVSNGDQVSRVASLAMKRGKRWTSRDIGSGFYSKTGDCCAQTAGIVLAKDIDVGQYAYTGATNSAALQAGGSVGEYIACREFAITQGRLEVDRSGTRIILLQACAEL
jgi:hypothetical protein